MTCDAAHFESMFTGNDDPWRFRSSWYEARKRALTLACLPDARYASAYEPGCANGELSAALATRCERLLVSDISAAAVRLARERLAGFAQVEVRQAELPAQWPAETFDLVVISELGYYLGEPALDELAARTRACLKDGGTVLACHWRWPIEGCRWAGDQVHLRLDRKLGLPLLGTVIERDLRLDVWCTHGRSVGEREGLAPSTEGHDSQASP